MSADQSPKPHFVLYPCKYTPSHILTCLRESAQRRIQALISQALLGSWHATPAAHAPMTSTSACTASTAIRPCLGSTGTCTITHSSWPAAPAAAGARHGSAGALLEAKRRSTPAGTGAMALAASPLDVRRSGDPPLTAPAPGVKLGVAGGPEAWSTDVLVLSGCSVVLASDLAAALRTDDA